MKTFKQKPSILLSILAIFNVSAQEITPDMFSVPANTGANMTLGVNASIFDQFAGSQIGAFYDLDEDGTLDCVGLESIQIGFFGLALWGDDSSTPYLDGLPSGAIPSFAILHQNQVIYVVDNTSYDTSSPWSNNNVGIYHLNYSGYVTNSIVNILDVTLFGSCGDCSPIEGCNDSFALNYNPSYFDGECVYPECAEIIINFNIGWNMFGYTSARENMDIGSVMGNFNDKIYIIKDNNGSQYWPANNYNGIGDFIPGGGYQIKAYESFSISFEN